jgi:hypothetical protein
MVIFTERKKRYMKGVSYITDEKSRKKAVVIEMKTLEKFDEQIEDLFDAIIAEARRDEPSVSWEILKKRLKKKGKL